jgi:propionate CoA-transferase
MHTPHSLTARQAADLIHDGDVITVSSSSGLGCPDAVLAGIGQRFAETNSPKGLTSVHPIAAGDMSGIKGIDHIAQRGLLARVIAGSYPSGPSSAEPPRIWQMIEHDELQAYNFPSGVLYQLHRAAAARQPGVLSKVGLHTFVDPRHGAGRMNTVTPTDFVRVHELDGQEWLLYDAIVPDVAIIRATTADTFGNLTFEEEASPLGALDLAYAAHNNGGIVIAQVKRVAEGRSLSPQAVRVPGILVDAIVIAEDQWQTTNTVYDPAISGELRRPMSVLNPVPFGLEKIMARRAAMELQSGEIANLGFGVSALVPHVLVEENLANAVSWVIEQGPVGGIPLLDFEFGVSQNPDAIMQSSDQFTLLQGGGFRHALLSFLEIDRFGNVNVHSLPKRRHVSAGIGGFADITSAAPSIVFVGSFTAGHRDIAVEDGRLRIRSDGPHAKFVNDVDSLTFSGQRALANGQQVLYVTERAVLELRPEGLTVVEIAPGIDLRRDILGRSECLLNVDPNVKTMARHLFVPETGGLVLPPMAPHPRLVGRAH